MGSLWRFMEDAWNNYCREEYKKYVVIYRCFTVACMVSNEKECIVAKIPLSYIFHKYASHVTWFDYYEVRITGRHMKDRRYQLRARGALMLPNDVPLRTRRALLLYKVYGNSTLLVLNGNKYCWIVLTPFWLSADNIWRVSSQNGLTPFWSIWDIWDLSCWNIK